MKSLGSLFSHGWVKLLLAFVLLSSVSWYIRDSRGVQFGLLGVIFWLAVALFAATFGVIYFAQFLIPIPGDHGWWQGIYLIRRGMGTSPPENTRTVTEKKEKNGRRRRKKTVAHEAPPNPDAPPPSFKTLKAGILRPYQVFALVRGKKFVGSRGPGFVILQPKEVIRHTIDLRDQRRIKRRVRVTTRDAIQIITNITVNFCIKPGESDTALYPYDKNAIFQISYADAIDEYGLPMPWKEKIVPQAITYATQEVSKYTLNQLTQLEGGVSNIDEINRVLQQKMEEKFSKRGIDILGARMSTPVLPDEIRDQYIYEWQINWDEKIQNKYVAREAQALRQRKEARARAQNKMIQAIARNLNHMKEHDDSDMVDIITLRMIEALEEAVAEGSVKAKIPQEIMARLIEDTSKQLRESAANATPKLPPPNATGTQTQEPPSEPPADPSPTDPSEPPAPPAEPLESEPISQSPTTDAPSEPSAAHVSSDPDTPISEPVSNLPTEPIAAPDEPTVEPPSSNLETDSSTTEPPPSDPPSQPMSNLPLPEELPETVDEDEDEPSYDEPQPPQNNMRKPGENKE